MTFLSNAEARRQNLTGSDTYKRIQLAYKDERNRDHFAISLNIEALKFLNLSIKITQHNALLSESLKVQEYLDNGTWAQDYQRPELISRLIKYMNLEYFYIAAGFEIHFKSWLLQNDYVVNEIHNSPHYVNLKKDQKVRPITRMELFAVSDYLYDTTLQLNILPGILDQSINFNQICKKAKYVDALNISPDVLGIVDDYRNLRNQLHLPGELCETPNIQKLGQESTQLLIDYINDRIVENSNQMIQANRFRFSELTKV